MKLRWMGWLVYSFILVLPVMANHVSNCTDGCGTPGHFYSGAGPYPFVEAIADVNNTAYSATVLGNSVWTDIIGPCKNGNVVIPNVRYSGTGNFNVLMRSFLKFYTDSVPSGTSLEVRFILKSSAGTEYSGGWYMRSTKGLTTADRPQGEWLSGLVSGLAPGDYSYYVRARLLGTSSTQKAIFVQRFGAVLGAPAIYGASVGGNSASITVNSTSWTEVASTTITNSSSDSINGHAQGYFQMFNATAGDKISVGFGVDSGSSGTHYSDVYVPSQLPDGIHVLDHIPNEVVAQLPANSTHTIRMYLKNMSGGSTPVQFRELAVMGTPSSIGGSAGAIATTPVTVSTGTTETQPLDCLLRSQTWDPELDACTSTSSTCYDVNTASCKPVGCGKWTKLLEFTTGSTSSNNYITGEGYLEITGNETWTGDTQINIALEFEYPLSHKTTDAHYVGFNLRQGEKRGIYFYTDGADLDMSNMVVRLWVRKVSGCGVEGTTASSFTVGKRYFFTKWVPATPACFGHTGS